MRGYSGMKRVYVGFDAREAVAYRVAVASMKRHASEPLSVIPLELGKLQCQGMLNRPIDMRNGLYDINSNAPQSTMFAVSRFLVPMLAQTGPAVFIDCDMLFMDDVVELFSLFDSKYAVQVVQHDHSPARQTKMDGAVQTRYARKNWSSVIMWNCDHPANLRLTLWDVNNRPGRDLHAFYWLAESEIGALPAGWNWLVNASASAAPRPAAELLPRCSRTLPAASQCHEVGGALASGFSTGQVLVGSDSGGGSMGDRKVEIFDTDQNNNRLPGRRNVAFAPPGHLAIVPQLFHGPVFPL